MSEVSARSLEALLLFAELDSDEELAVLDALESCKAAFVERLDIESLSNEECRKLFRFDKKDLQPLRHALLIPESICSNQINRIRASGLEAMCIFLRRMAYPSRLSDLARLFGRSKCDLSILFNYIVNHVYDNFKNLLTNIQQPWLDIAHIAMYAAAVKRQGAPLDNCWGFIDGTVRPIARPNKYQKVAFSGHKRVHAIKFQSVMLPNGIIAHLYGPMEGRRHDCALLTESGLLEQLQEVMNCEDGTPYCLYGDPAYPIRPHLLCPYKGANLSNEQQEFNKTMSSLRVCVEWGFGKVTNQFAFLDYKKNLKLFLQPVAKYYAVGTLLANCHTCLYGSQTGSFFECIPPNLNEYLGGGQ